MRRILSILLLGLLLYNMVGYSITYLLECQTSASTSYGDMIEHSLNSPNIIIKVPLAAPYQSNWSASEPIDSHLDGKGQFYQIKAQQIINDTLYVYCQFDENAREHFVDLVSKINLAASADAAGTPNDGHSQLLKNFLKEYVDINHKFLFCILEWIPDYPIAVVTNAPFLLGVKPAVALPPPDIA